MARIRTIKPDFFRSKTVARLTAEERITFIGLWCHVDDDGRCELDLELIKADVWPRSRSICDILTDLVALERESLIIHYVLTEPAVSAPTLLTDRSLICVTGFSEHQRINRRTPSKLPTPRDGRITPLSSVFAKLTESTVNTHGTLSEDSSTQNASPVRTHGTLSEDSPPERKGKERNPTTSDALRADATPQPITAQAVVAAWVGSCRRATKSEPSRGQINQVGKLARELLAANDPGLVLAAATDAGAKGFATIDRELTARAARTSTTDAAHRYDPNTGRGVDLAW